MRLRRLDADLVTAAAAAIVDAQGIGALTLSRLATELGVAPPSLYKHVAGLEDLIGRVATFATRRLADVLTAAAIGASGRHALVAIASAHRRFAIAHRGLYPLTQNGMAVDAAALRVEAKRCLIVFEALVESYRLPRTAAIDAIRIVRSALHGFCDIEVRGGFQMRRSIDASFMVLLDAVDAALRDLARGRGAKPSSLSPRNDASRARSARRRPAKES